MKTVSFRTPHRYCLPPSVLRVVLTRMHIQGTSINSFIPLQVLSWPSPVTSSTSCNIGLFKHTSTSSLYAVKTFTKSSISYDTPILEHAMKEQMILRLLTQMNLPYVLKLRWSFQDSESMRLVTVCPVYAFLKPTEC